MNELDQLRRQQDVLANFGEFALRSNNLDEVLTEACRLVADALGTKRAKVLEIERGGQTLLVRAGVGWDDDVVGQVHLLMDERSSESYAIAKRKPIIMRNVRTEDRFEIPDFMKDAGIAALANVPIYLPNDKAYGLLQVDEAEPRAFNEADTRFLRTYAIILGPVVDRLFKLEDLRRSEERSRLIADNARDHAILITDTDGLITDWLPGAEAVFGWTAEEAIGQPYAILFTSKDQEQGEDKREIEATLRQGTSSNVRWHQRKNGQRIFIDGVTTRLESENGTLQGFLKIGQDITRRHETEQLVRQSRRRLRTLVNGMAQLVWRSKEGARWTWSSPQWQTYTGQTEEESHGLGWLEALHPEDRDKAMMAWGQAEASGEQLDFECRLRDASTSDYRWFQTRALPVHDEDTNDIAEWLGTSTDIDDLLKLQKAQKVMVAELQHRTRNLIGVVRSISAQTIRKSQSLDDYAAKFAKRLNALLRVQDLLSQSGTERITIGDVVRLELDALGAEGLEDRIEMDGPVVPVRKTLVQTLSLALHELATNARKYGALSNDDGQLVVRWHVNESDSAKPRLFLEWIETGIELAKEKQSPATSGYGRELLEKALPYAMKARTTYDLGQEGLRCTIDLPLPTD